MQMSTVIYTLKVFLIHGVVNLGLVKMINQTKYDQILIFPHVWSKDRFGPK